MRLPFITASPAEGASERVPHRASGLLLLLSLFICFWRLGSVPLFDLDEALYVTCARQMLLSGDYTTPRLNSHPPDRPAEATVPFFEKPILVYWMAAGAMRLFGMSEGAVRIPVACAALITTGLIVLAGRRWFGWRAGLLAGLTFVTAPMTVIDARQMTTDGLLVLWYTLAMFAFAETSVKETSRNKLPEGQVSHSVLPYPVPIFWIACALAILTKGAIGLLLPSIVIGVWLLWGRLQLRIRSASILVRFRWKSLHAGLIRIGALRPLVGLLLLIVIAAPWHIAVSRAGGRDALGHTFVEEYIGRQHIGRFRGGDKVHNAPLPTYIVFFLIGFFPWSCFAPAALLSVRRKTGATTLISPDADGADSTEPDMEARIGFLRVWFWTIFVFFSISAAKLPTYIAPAYPAAALLVGRWLDLALARSQSRTVFSRGAAVTACIGGLLCLVAVFAPRLAPPNSPIPGEVVTLALTLSLTLALGCTAAWAAVRFASQNKSVRMGIILLTTTMLVLYGIMVTEGYSIARRFLIEPYQQLAASANQEAAAGVPVVFYHIIPRRPSMLFYANYSAYERKETPLLPYLSPLLKGPVKQALVITSSRSLDQVLLPELNQAIGVRYRVEQTAGNDRDGWVKIRIILK